VAGALVFGVLGVLLATPVLASARLILIYIYRKLLDREPFEPERGPAGVRIRGLIAGRKIEAVSFDLDGTLTALDWSATQWAVSYFYWLERVLPSPRRKLAAQRLMVTLEGLINFLVSQARRLGWHNHAQLQRLLPVLDRLRGYPPADDLMVLPGVAQTLHRLANSYRLVLITPRDRASVEQFLHRAGLDQGVFELVLTGEDVRNVLPHSEGLVTIAERLNLEANQLLMVSDTDVNLRAASAMELATAGVLGGLGRAADLREADLVLTSLVELEAWL
jgi:phosphoglycolate phosphatase-like HAD superfamily hydrolase